MVVLVAAAPAAWGSTAQADGTTLTFVASPGEDNHLVVDSDSSGHIQVIDDYPITAGAGCHPASIPTAAFCLANRIDISTGDGNDFVDLGRQRTPGTAAPAAVDLGPGDDTFDANSNEAVTAPVSVQGGDGNDTIFGGYGDDDIDGGPGNDFTLSGDYSNNNGAGQSRDTISGGPGDDRIFGAGGNDVLTGDAGSDRIFAGTGNDDIETLDGEFDYVDCFSGFDTVNSDAGDQLEPSCRPPDSDGDGLPDSWEIHGVDLDDDGTVDLDLPAMGADPMHKDIFLEIDAMDGHELEQLSVDLVVQAFANAPVTNPDGSSGIALHVDNGPASVMNPRTGALWGSLSRHDVAGSPAGVGHRGRATTYNWGAFDAIKAAHLDAQAPLGLSLRGRGPPVRQRRRRSRVASRAASGRAT